MGAPRGNQNASKGKKMHRYQNISTVVTSVSFEDGRHRTMKPGMTVNLTSDDVQTTIDSHNDPEKNPFDLGLLVEVPAGLTSHPDAPLKHRRTSGEQVKLLIAEGTIEEIETAIMALPDSGGVQTFHRALISFGETLNKKRDQLVTELLETRGAQLADETKALRHKYDEKLSVSI